MSQPVAAATDPTDAYGIECWTCRLICPGGPWPRAEAEQLAGEHDHDQHRGQPVAQIVPA